MRVTVTEPKIPAPHAKTLRMQVPIYSYSLATSLRLTNRIDTPVVVHYITGKDADRHDRSIIRITPANKYATRKWRIYLLTKQNQG